MKEAFDDVVRLDSIENVGLSRKGCKLAEEAGELMQVICRYIGMKHNEMTPQEMQEEAFGEIADVVQNCFCIANQFGITFEDLLCESRKQKRFPKIDEVSKTKIDENKNYEFNPDVLAEYGCLFSNSVGKLMKKITKKIFASNNHNKQKIILRINDVIDDALSIACLLDVDMFEVENKILEKNKKWLKRIEKRG
jgi:NTP pyrophosphatase (non-canonical NTP hydrolase)